MPIYEYQCSVCGHKLEALQKFSDKPLTDCPKCQQQTLGKLVSAAGFQLKGTGWYKTDYSTKGKAKPAQETEGSGPDSKSGDYKADKPRTDAQSKESSSSKEAASSSSTSSKNTSSSGSGPSSHSGEGK